MNISLENIDNAPFSYKDVKKIVFFDNSWYILADNKVWQTNDAKNWKDLNLSIASFQEAVFSVSKDALIIASNYGGGKIDFYVKRKGDYNFSSMTLNVDAPHRVETAGAMYFKDRIYFFINKWIRRIHEEEGIIFNSKKEYFAPELTIYSTSFSGDLKEEEVWGSGSYAEKEAITIVNNRPVLISEVKRFDGTTGNDFHYLTKENGWKYSASIIEGSFFYNNKLILVNNGAYYFKGNHLYFSDDGKYWDLVGIWDYSHSIETATIGFNSEICLFSLGCGDEICYFSKNDSRRYPYKLCYGNSKVKPENYQSVEIKVLPNCLAFNEQGVGLLSTNTEDEEGIYLLKITR